MSREKQAKKLITLEELNKAEERRDNNINKVKKQTNEREKEILSEIMEVKKENKKIKYENKKLKMHITDMYFMGAWGIGAVLVAAIIIAVIGR